MPKWRRLFRRRCGAPNLRASRCFEIKRMALAPPTSSAPSVNAMVCSSKTFENQGVSPKDQMGQRGCSFVSGGAGSSNGAFVPGSSTK